MLSTLMQDACRKLDIVGTGAPWKMRAGDGLIHHAVQSTWDQIMGNTTTPSRRQSQAPKAHLSPARSRSEEREEPKGGRRSFKFGAAAESCSVGDMKAAETRITELRAQLLEQQAQQSAVDRHKLPRYVEGSVAKAKLATANQQMHIGTKGKAPPASRDRRWHSDAADDWPAREDSEAQAAAAADAMVAKLRQEIHLADSARELLESPKAPEPAEERQESSMTICPEAGPEVPDHSEYDRTSPAPVFSETIDHDVKKQALPSAAFPEVDVPVNASETDPYLLASVLQPPAHDSDTLAVLSAPSVVEEVSPPPTTVETSPPPPPPPPPAGPSSKRSFARPLRRLTGTTRIPTSVPLCPPVRDAAKDDEDSDEWPEDQLGERLRLCMPGCVMRSCSHCIDLN